MYTKTTIAAVLLLTRAAFGAPAAEMAKRVGSCTVGDDSTCSAGETCVSMPSYIMTPITTYCAPTIQKRVESCTVGDDSTCSAGETCVSVPSYIMTPFTTMCVDVIGRRG